VATDLNGRRFEVVMSCGAWWEEPEVDMMEHL
jgi:hypothetical protein